MKRTLTCTMLVVCVLGMASCGGDGKLIAAAEGGDVAAQLELGLKYSIGSITDWKEAVKWFGEAAEKGNAEAQYNLGKMIIENRGARKEGTVAVKWLNKAAEQGNADAQLLLGHIYNGDYGPDFDEGTEVTPDPAAAKMWYGKAAENGNANAQEALDNLK